MPENFERRREIMVEHIDTVMRLWRGETVPARNGAGQTIHWRGASSTFDNFGKFQPNQGAYDTWSYNEQGKAIDSDPSVQIKIG